MAKKSPDPPSIEQYDYQGICRLNNPPVGLVTADTEPEEGRKTYEYDPYLDPQLVWAGKAEHTSFDVPTVSLHVHERIDPRTIIQAACSAEPARQASLFEFEVENRPIREAIEFYRHKHNWSNRLVAGDSLLIMNSLLEKEGMAGKVQMIYIDPPYGIKYGSNFQPFVNKRDVRDGKDEDLTAEPEMIKAFRDTWELGIHSYLSYLRDRLLLARELLTESGSVFVQISDENVHHVREIMDEVFGKENFVVLICYRRLGIMIGSQIKSSSHYLVWYTKDINRFKNHKIFEEQIAGIGSGDHFTQLELITSGNTRPMTRDERRDPKAIPADALPFQLVSLQTYGVASKNTFPINYKGRKFLPGANKAWRTTDNGIDCLINSNRVQIAGKTIRYKQYLYDFPFTEVGSIWTNAGRDLYNYYVVQTPSNIIERCLLMTTDPGDLVLDPTCGSGTTAFVAEKWGRRWITCDTSRVAVTLAKQRLMTPLFEYYELARPEEGVASGFVYDTVPHITLKSIAHNEKIDRIHERFQPKLEKLLAALNEAAGSAFEEWEVPFEPVESWPDAAKTAHAQYLELRRKRQAGMDKSIGDNAPQETLYDKPLVDKDKVRVTGPFTIEAVPSPTVRPLTGEITTPAAADASAGRSGESLRQAEWRDELLRTGVRGKGGQVLSFTRLEPLGGLRWLHAEGETKEDQPKPVVISFGPEHAPLEQKQVEWAIEEAQTLVPRPRIIIFAAFQYDPEAAKDIDAVHWPGVTVLKAQMNPDLFTDDLKKKRASNESFWFIGQPDVSLDKIADGPDAGRYTVTVRGFDYYDTVTGQIESGGPGRIAMWLLDPAYDGRSLFPRQVFFPMAGPKDGWARLAKNLNAIIDEEKIEAYRGTTSLPFKPGERVAVKIIDDRGIESMRILEVRR